MADWSKLKVTELKEECKSRDIPLTGLKLKQQYIDKLEEYEAQIGDWPNENEDEDQQGTEPVEEPPAPQVNGDARGGLDADTGANDTAKDEVPTAAGREQTPGSGKSEGGADEPSAIQEKDRHSQDKKEIKEQPITEASAQADENETKEVPENMAENIVEKAEEKSEEDNKTVEATGESDDAVAGAGMALKEKAQEGEAMNADQNAESQKPAVLSTPQLTENLSDSNTSHSSQILSSDLGEDQRKRRKRSATPVPSTQDVARKRARLAEDAEESKAAEAPDQMREETEEAKDIRGEQTNGEAPKVTVEEPGEGVVTTKPLSAFQDTTPTEPKAKDQEDQTVSMSPPRSTTSSEDRDIPPAIHPATSSIYIRNFKRPLHIPSLRAHIASIAKSRSADDSDPINVFYLDSIRTHAFVSFTSVAAASRVRSAMHGSRFPDEPLREPLFVDYVPPNKVQTWIDQETGSGFGRGGNGRRFEVVYEEDENGVEAIFQEVDSSKPRPPPFDTSRSSRLSFDRQQSESLSAGLHPDREALIPRGSQNRDRDRDHQRAPPAGPQNPSSSNGTGFKELDELFDSTSTKPKLYYKPVPSSVVDERLDMFRSLRPGWEEMGRSGDEGMKRYSFERSKDREEWVDKGPEFGFGRKGQARLVGVGAGRGRGGGYRGRPMDSWRGGR